MTKSSSSRPAKRSEWQPEWAEWPDEDLLDLRFCDLQVSLTAPRLSRHLERLYAELTARGLTFRPHVWLSEEWFSPDGVPGFAIPFYLAHPRLMRLERRMMHEVEGGNSRWLMRILRHETGHAIDSAFRLRYSAAWQRVFGHGLRRYPLKYRPRPASRRYVLHLGHWYAQSHPTEDFAETFAVWLPRRSPWRQDYESWPALRKLEYVDETMHALKDCSAKVRRRRHVEPLVHNTRTLREHYTEKMRFYNTGRKKARYDQRLKRLFGAPVAGRVRASTFLREVRPQLVRLMIRNLRLHSYLIHQVMRMLILRSDELGLTLRGSQRDAKRAAAKLLERCLADLLRHNRETYAL